MILIEDAIIAYFDKRLSDAERADLLQQVSANPEHRKLFQQHEALRGRMQLARANVSVQPHIEDGLFSRIAALQPKVRPLIPAFARIPMSAYATLALATIATLYFAVPNMVQRNEQLSGVEVHSSVTRTSEVSSKATLKNGAESVATAATHSTRVKSVPQSQITSDREQFAVKENVKNPAAVEPTIAPIGLAAKAPHEVAIESRLVGPSDAMLHASGATLVSESHSFEFSLEGTNGTVYPTGMHHMWDASGARASVGYFITPSNLIGLRVSGLSVRTSPIAIMPQQGNTIRPDTGQFSMRYAGELYLEHQEILMNGKLLLIGSISGGLIQQGNLISADLGIRIPFTAHLQGGLSYSLSRVHSNENLQYYDVARNSIETRSPNSLSSRLLYGMSYEF